MIGFAFVRIGFAFFGFSDSRIDGKGGNSNLVGQTVKDPIPFDPSYKIAEGKIGDSAGNSFVQKIPSHRRKSNFFTDDSKDGRNDVELR